MASADAELLQRAVDLAARSAIEGGGPFGALIADGGGVVAEGHNRVTADGDPTAHAEVVAIRAACITRGTHLLDGCVLYTSCEPCPMCLAAAWWARVERVVFAASRQDAADVGFDDSALYDEVAAPLSSRVLPIAQVPLADPLAPFTAWTANPDRIHY